MKGKWNIGYKAIVWFFKERGGGRKSRDRLNISCDKSMEVKGDLPILKSHPNMHCQKIISTTILFSKQCLKA